MYAKRILQTISFKEVVMKKYYKLNSVDYNEERREATIYISVDRKTLKSVMTISDWDCVKDMPKNEVEERLAEIGWYPEKDRLEEEVVTINKNNLYVMLTAATYAGYIEGKGKGFLDDFGSDAFDHLDDYIEYGQNYLLLKDKRGFFDTERMRADAVAWANTYAKKFN